MLCRTKNAVSGLRGAARQPWRLSEGVLRQRRGRHPRLWQAREDYCEPDIDEHAARLLTALHAAACCMITVMASTLLRTHPDLRSIVDAVKAHPKADVFINFASMRR